MSGSNSDRTKACTTHAHTQRRRSAAYSENATCCDIKSFFTSTTSVRARHPSLWCVHCTVRALVGESRLIGGSARGQGRARQGKARQGRGRSVDGSSNLNGRFWRHSACTCATAQSGAAQRGAAQRGRFFTGPTSTFVASFCPPQEICARRRSRTERRCLPRPSNERTSSRSERHGRKQNRPRAVRSKCLGAGAEGAQRGGCVRVPQ
jgi:hypothetical protein